MAPPPPPSFACQGGGGPAAAEPELLYTYTLPAGEHYSALGPFASDLLRREPSLRGVAERLQCGPVTRELDGVRYGPVGAQHGRSRGGCDEFLLDEALHAGPAVARSSRSRRTIDAYTRAWVRGGLAGGS